MAIDFRSTQQVGSNAAAEETGEPVSTREYFLQRLTRLAKKSALLSRYLVPTDRRMRLLNHAILTTYDDCRVLGAGGEAKAIIEEARREPLLAPR